ncbi:MAG: O-antigen ligase family protein [Bacteroidia bacterium]|nr:O-antigen ligase family protein [Bacteroidia bacterium]
MKSERSTLYRIYLYLPIVAGLIILLTGYSRKLMDPVLLPKFLLTSLASIFFLLVIFFKDQGKQILHLLFTHSWLWAYLVYIALSGISLFYTPNPADGFFEWNVSGLFLVFFLIMASVSPPLPKMTGLIAVFTLAVLIPGILQYKTIVVEFGVSHHSSYLVSSVFGHKNIFAECLLLLFPLNFYGSFTSKKYEKILSLTALVLSLVFIILLLSRAVWVAFLGASIMSFALFLLTGNRWKSFRIRRTYLLTAGTIVFISITAAVIFYTKADSSETFVKQVTSIADFQHSSTGDRIGLWKRSLTLWREKPLIGHGTGSWKTEVLRLGTDGLKSAAGGINFVRPHNDYLWILAENGVLGFVAYLSFWLLLIKSLIRNLQNEKEETFQQVVAGFGLFAYMIFAFLSFPRERIEDSVLLGITLLPFIRAMDKPLIKNSSSYLSGFVLLVLTGILGCGLYVGYQRYQGEKHVYRAIQLQGRQQWDRALRELQSVNLRYLPMDRTGTPVQLYIGSIYMLKFQPKYGCSEYQRALAIHPHNPEVIAGLAQCYKLSGQKEMAETFFKKSLAITPFHHKVLIRLTHFYLENDRQDEAITALRKVDPRLKDSDYDQVIEKIIPIELNRINQLSQYQPLAQWLADTTKKKPNLNHIFRESIFRQQPFADQLAEYAGIRPNANP